MLLVRQEGVLHTLLLNVLFEALAPLPPYDIKSHAFFGGLMLPWP